MNAAISGILTEVVVDTLKKLAFLFAAPLEGPVPEDPRGLACVRVRFSGPVGGGMQLCLSPAVLSELAVNMLGVDDGSVLSEGEQQDALRELINVICGNLLPLICGSSAEFNMQTPTVLTGGDPGGSGFGPAAAVSQLSVESGVCRVALQLDGPVPVQGAGS